MTQRVRSIGVCSAAVLIALAGCTNDPRDRFGRTYYIDGAGNWGFGVREMKDGLAAAGYRGRVETWPWSSTLNPALDQTIGRGFARTRGADLGREITQYRKEYPQNRVNIIALSAGTGVAVWACENVSPPATVHNVVLLGSSISSNYDMTKAMRAVDGKVFVYYSPYDSILNGPVRTLGTIDGTFDIPAGTRGLRPREPYKDKIANIGWSRRYERYGWTGAHTDCTSEPFVRHVLAKYVVLPHEPRAPTDANGSGHAASELGHATRVSFEPTRSDAFIARWAQSPVSHE
jgi:hypothetical protein